MARFKIYEPDSTGRMEFHAQYYMADSVDKSFKRLRQEVAALRKQLANTWKGRPPQLKYYLAEDINEMDDDRLERSRTGKIQCTRVYIKRDADKVIRSLKTALKSSKAQNQSLMDMIRDLKEKR